MRTLMEGRVIWLARQNAMISMSLVGTAKDDEYRDFLAALAVELKNGRFVVLCDVRDAGSTPTTRQMWANFVKEHYEQMGST